MIEFFELKNALEWILWLFVYMLGASIVFGSICAGLNRVLLKLNEL